MNTPRFVFALGCAFALVAVACGAFGAHALSARLAPDRLEIWETAARYQMYHALALLALGIAGFQSPRFGIAAAAWAFSIGILIFCGSLYLLATGAPRWFGAITPIGGLAFMAGWALAAWSALRA